MRLLYIPFFSNGGNHNGCSVYNVMKVIFRHWVDIEPNLYVYFLLPSNIAYKEEEILNHPRIEKVYVRAIGNDQYDEKLMVPEEIYNLFNVNTGKFVFNAVVCDKVNITPWVKMIIEDKKKEIQRVPYFNFSQFIAKKDGRLRNILEEYEASCAFGWLSGFNVFQNERHAKRCFDICQEYLTPFFVKRVMNNSKVINLFGIDIQTLDKIYEGNKYKVGEELRINYAHRMATHYNPMFVLDAVDTVFSSGEKIKFVITTPSIATGTAVRKRLNDMVKRGLPIETYHALPQEEYYEKAKNCHLFISAINETETANSIFEQLYLGQVGIFPTADWVKSFLPDYPYMYKNLEEAYMFVKKFIKEPKEMIEVCQKYRKMIREKWDIRRNSEGVLRWMISIIANYKVQPRVIEITHEVLTKAGYPNSITFEELKKIFKEHSRQGIRIHERGYRGYNKFDWINAIKELGYRDTLERELRFVKE